MRLYLETSALLAWLLDEPSSLAVETSLQQAEIIVASELCILESERALIRAVSIDALTHSQARAARANLHRAARHWHLHLLRSSVFDRACQAFPVEPLRSLDALHLATALEAREAIPGLALLSLDRRLAASAAALGFEVHPGAP